MIFIFNSGGDLIKAVPEKVYQGSNKANRIWVLAPVPQSAFVTIVYSLPNGDVLPETNLTRIISESELPMFDKYGNNYSAWYIDIDAPVTAIAGEVSLQFNIRVLTKTPYVIATPEVILPIERGVAPLVQPEKTNSYQDLLGYLQILYSQFLNEELKGEKGEQGDQGDKGDNGLSAYQIWLNAGNSGSEIAFLESLKGEKGEKGDKGDQGEGGGTSTDVQLNGTSITENGVANIPIGRGVLGALKTNFEKGIDCGSSTGELEILPATESLILGKLNNYRPIVPNNLDYAIKVGLTTNTEVLSDEEQGKACEFIGALPKPNSESNCLIGYNNSVGVQIKYFTNTIPYAGRFCTPGTVNEGATEPAGDGYYVQKDPVQPYHLATRHFVEEQITNTGGGGAGGSKMYKHTLIFGGSQNLPPDCKAIIRNERSIPYTDWQTLMHENIAFPFSNQLVAYSGFIYCNLKDLGTTDEFGDKSIFFWSFGENTTSPTDRYHRVSDEILVDEVEEI